MQTKSWFRCLLVVGALSCAVTAIADDGMREALFVLGQSATVAEGEQVESAIVIGGDLEVRGKVRGLAAAVGGDLRAGPRATIGGPAAAIGGELSLDAAARVSGPKLHVAPGNFSQVMSELSAGKEPRPPPFWAGSAIRVFQVLSAFLLGLILVGWAPRQVRTVRDALRGAPSRDLLLGLALVAGVAPLCVLLAISIVGIPLIPVVLLFALACFTYGLVGVGAVLGRRLSTAKSDEPLLASVTIGMLALAAAAALPFLGAFLLIAASVYGAGAVLATRFGTKLPTEPGDRPTSPPTAADTHLGEVH